MTVVIESKEIRNYLFEIRTAGAGFQVSKSRIEDREHCKTIRTATFATEKSARNAFTRWINA